MQKSVFTIILVTRKFLKWHLLHMHTSLGLIDVLIELRKLEAIWKLTRIRSTWSFWRIMGKRADVWRYHCCVWRDRSRIWQINSGVIWWIITWPGFRTLGFCMAIICGIFKYKFIRIYLKSKACSKQCLRKIML